MNETLFSRRLWAIFVLVVICGFCLSAQAKYGGGTGEPNDPYLIYTAEQMNEIGLMVNSGDWDKHFKLMADIDLSGFTGTSFNLIGSSWLVAFTGVFDGNDHTISNFTYASTDTAYIALFVYVDDPNAEIKNLGLIDPNLDAGTEDYVGSLVGQLNGGTITNCYVQGGSVAGGSYVGGLIGDNNGNITNCYATCSVSGGTNIGGLIGENDGTITNCYAMGSVSGGTSVGGLIGYNNGTITNSSAICSVSGGTNVGVFIGENYGAITRCYSLGSVEGDVCVGGLMGYNNGRFGSTITNCYSLGSVSGNSVVGGLAGYNDGRSGGSITNCYSAGSVTGDEYLGGLVGYNWEGVVNYCFWDIDTSGQATSAAGTGKTNTEMQTASTFSAWVSCEPVWTINDGDDYPRLAWENAPGEPITIQLLLGGGSGTEADPYLINTAEKLNTVGSMPCLWDRHFKLMADIDLSAYTGTSFNIIGTSWDNAFAGVFDGNDHIISNFTYTSTGAYYTGLFGLVHGEIKNLGLIDPDVDGGTSSKVGSLVGRNDGTITNCYVEGGSISGNENIGGLVGHNVVTITNCYSEADVSGNERVGGLVGWNQNGIVTNCSTSGNVTGIDWVGGLVGTNSSDSTTINSKIINSCSTGSVSGDRYVGGAVGSNYCTITNGYATGSVSGNDRVGGLVGINGSTTTGGTITNCYSAGRVSGTTDVGGLVGYHYEGEVTNSFWDIDTSEQSSSAGGGSGRTTTQMKMASTYLGWNGCGEIIWTIDEGVDYPRLLWENRPGQPLSEHQLRDFLQGSGSEIDPYLVHTAEQLNMIGLFLCEWDKHFKLMADIDLSGFTGTSFNIIGAGEGLPFTGVFDGNGHTISNFTYTSTAISLIGLFGYASQGEIKNLGLIDPNVDAGTGNYVGSLVGQLGYGGTITSCYVYVVSVTGGGYVGGLVGYNSGTISNCYATGSVTGSYRIGGLVGENYQASIVNCYSTASVAGGYDAGGLVGRNDLNSTITNCCATGSVSGTTSVGGLVGENYEGKITNCYSNGSVSGNDRVGGLVGENWETITNCYSAGSVSGSGNNVGGLVGSDNSGSYTKSFWDNTVNSGLPGIGNTSNPNVIGESTANMQTRSTFTDAGWDFVGEWENGPSDEWAGPPGGGYPILWWQLSPLAPLPTFSGGTGEPDDPYLISTANDLNRIGHNPRLMAAHFEIINDISLTGINLFTIGSQPIPFTGVFDGNDHVISNFTYDSNDRDYIGLFEYASQGEIKNLGLIDPNVNAGTGRYVGILVGQNGGTITNCYVQGGTVSGRLDVGGLVGRNNGTVTNCYSEADVSGSTRVGGLCGWNFKTITDCYSTGSVLGSGNNVGGLVGHNRDTISNSHSVCSVSGSGNNVGGIAGNNIGVITNCCSTGSVAGASSVGGLAGRNYLNGTISNCYATGNVSGSGNNVGGLVGNNRDTVSNSYSVSSVSGSGNNAGGLVGNNGSGGSITNSFSAGSVTGDGYVGGLIGSDNSGSCTKSFWDNTVNSGLPGIGNANDPNVIGESTANMQTQSTFTDAGWDFVAESVNGTEDIWCICEGVDYPKLTWQFIIGDFDGDGDIDFGDYALLAARWQGTDNSFWCAAGGTDLTNDGMVTFDDLRYLANGWLSGI